MLAVAQESSLVRTIVVEFEWLTWVVLWPAARAVDTNRGVTRLVSFMGDVVADVTGSTHVDISAYIYMSFLWLVSSIEFLFFSFK